MLRSLPSRTITALASVLARSAPQRAEGLQRFLLPCQRMTRRCHLIAGPPALPVNLVPPVQLARLWVCPDQKSQQGYDPRPEC